MVKTLLLTLDEAPYEAALTALGVAWAKRYRALLVGLAVIDELVVSPPEPVPIGWTYYKERLDEHRLRVAREKADRLLERFTSRCRDAGVPCMSLEQIGEPAGQIQQEAQRYDLILAGVRGALHPEAPPSTSHALHRVLKNSVRPVVAVPPEWRAGSGAVVAYDGSFQAARALQAFVAGGLAADRDVHVVSVGERASDAALVGDRAVDFLRYHGIAARLHALAEDAPIADLLLGQVRSLGAELLVMGAYGRRTFREFFVGSVTNGILARTEVPVFLYH